VTVTAAGARPTGRRTLGDEFETVGVAPIPDAQRTITAPRLFVLWAMAWAAAHRPAPVLIHEVLSP
jgi:hypothetical protein